MIRVSEGKYTFRKDGKGGIEVLRYDEAWHQQTQAANAISSLMYELDAARVVLAAARALVAEYTANGEIKAMGELVASLEQHARLVTDQEPPSEWAVSP